MDYTDRQEAMTAAVSRWQRQEHFGTDLRGIMWSARSRCSATATCRCNIFLWSILITGRSAVTAAYERVTVAPGDLQNGVADKDGNSLLSAICCNARRCRTVGVQSVDRYPDARSAREAVREPDKLEKISPSTSEKQFSRDSLASRVHLNWTILSTF